MGTRNFVSTSPGLKLHVHGRIYRLNRDLVVAKSAKLAHLSKESQHERKPLLSLPDIPGDPETFELVAGFFDGHEPKFSASIVIPLISLASYLEMTEAHCPNNLLNKSLAFFKWRVLCSWNETIKAFRASEHVLMQASNLGLVDDCLNSLTQKALTDPTLLGGSIQYEIDGNNNDNGLRRVKRRLFVHDREFEDLNTFPLCLYKLIMLAMVQHGVRSDYVAGSLFQYAKKWAFTSCGESGVLRHMKMVSQREVIEVVERLLPDKRSLIPCKLLSEMLQAAITLHAGSRCINGFEFRIGKQLDEATVEDLLIPCQSYAREMQYDTQSVMRILNYFCENYPSEKDLIIVAELMDEFLAEVAGDIDMQKDTFISLLAGISVAASHKTGRNADGMYRAIDIYLDKHTYLTETEKDEICSVLDIHSMTAAARKHAVTNERLPLQVVVQVLFVEQLQMRNIIADEMQGLEERCRREEEKVTVPRGEEEEVRTEMEEMNGRVMELEEKCNKMRKEIAIGQRSTFQRKKGKEKGKESLWKQLKGKFGCSSSIHEHACHKRKKEDSASK